MTLAGFLVEIRRRAPGQPRPTSLEHAVATVTGLATMPGPQGNAIRAVVRALLAPEARVDMAFREVATMGPLALGALDYIVEALLEGRYSAAELREATGLRANA